MTKGWFISVEGGEGAGKGSALAGLGEVLERRGCDVLVTREPGGTPESLAIRSLVVERRERDWTPLGELLLLMAARAEHVVRTIRPALAAGRTVLCDRFEASTFAYQGAGKGVPAEQIARAQEIAAGGLLPDYTVLFDVDPRVGLARSARRLAQSGSNEDRFEALDLAFHERVRRSFLDQAGQAPQRWIVVDAGRPLETVLAEASEALDRRLGLGMSRND